MGVNSFPSFFAIFVSLAVTACKVTKKSRDGKMNPEVFTFFRQLIKTLLSGVIGFYALRWRILCFIVAV
jgi:hypothetical protein